MDDTGREPKTPVIVRVIGIDYGIKTSMQYDHMSFWLLFGWIQSGNLVHLCYLIINLYS